MIDTTMLPKAYPARYFMSSCPFRHLNNVSLDMYTKILRKVEKRCKFECNGDGVDYNTYLGNEVISRQKDLETAKEDAKTHIFTLYYKTKIFLELHE